MSELIERLAKEAGIHPEPPPAWHYLGTYVPVDMLANFARVVAEECAREAEAGMPRDLAAAWKGTMAGAITSAAMRIRSKFPPPEVTG